MSDKIKVVFIESEAGWGQRVDEVRTMDTLDEAKKLVTEFNSSNDKDYVPDWYMYAYVTVNGISV